jgi:2-C-methyl-D-erythritol 4-phosphate cytidylyltransferase/2-C-methyl-D-erythritol 2,4-cyclodiphosphate synthase
VAEQRPFADAVIVAAGSSTRMGGTDKNAAMILGRSMLEWSVASMAAARAVDRVVVVARADRVESVEALQSMAGVHVVAGGAERSDSVRNGIAATSAPVILVHDAARPLASPELADAVAAAAAQHGAAVPVVPVVDSLKRAGSGVLQESVDRSGLVRTQTPQGARRELLIDAFASANSASYTDEAALLESRGILVATVPGEATNLKVTEQSDLEVVRAIAAARQRALASPSSGMRFGLGQDSHGFGPETGLRLGGVVIDTAPRLYGHSDGDVILHAAASAVLSAAGLGDLGRLFPASDPRTKGVDSADLLGQAVDQALHGGWLVDSAQVSLVGARPKLGAKRIDAIAERVAQILGVDRESVSITASTGNLYGPEGAGLVISATCLVAVHRR